ncbi:NYN domain-containing protein [Pseudomonas sp. LPB0260]|uniref:NYN domain-containing protein n=1 Tax=Pseudomonas sp. LPB0260 TaxID=2614442 RepID=UPI0015C20943|nr:NYN domain-containing protein [Pseudomonas sp. LPB0260]QLC73680.1 NYN domain-containing protein [Pseudomonas sp. LPB0260]QLC76454.1 NYN domain-containing protein [Pseudomonas sp. LPB0260]
MATKPSSTRQQKLLAVLIDADNASAAIVEGLFEEIAKFGVASVKRIYGDWTQPNLGKWKQVLLDHSIQPIQQFAYTRGKNATDSALIIDAMDLLYTRRFDGFCLVSSDSDFTRLAARLREEGLTVYGFGEEKTPSPFVSACDKFIYTEILRADAADATDEQPGNGDKNKAAAGDSPPAEPAKATARKKPQKVPVDFIAKLIDDIDDEDGWVELGVLGQNISKLRPAFDARLYGFKKLSELIKGQAKRFELQVRGSSATGGEALYVRNRKAGK